MDALDLPAWLSPEGHAAARRMHRSLVARGAWRPEFERSLGLAAAAAATYARLVAAGLPPDHPQLQDHRRVARQLLAEMRYVDAARVHLGLVDARGFDRELLALCAVR